MPFDHVPSISRGRIPGDIAHVTFPPPFLKFPKNDRGNSEDKKENVQSSVLTI